MTFFQVGISDKSMLLEEGALVQAANILDGIDGEGLNKYHQVAQVFTFTIGTATADAVYTVTVNGVDVSITAPSGSPTAGEIAILLAAAINAVGEIGAEINTTAVGSTVVLTSRHSGLAFTASDADAKITNVATTASASAEAVPFGRAVVSRGVGINARAPLTRYVGLASAAHLTAQVDNYAITYDAGKHIVLQIRMEGQVFTVSDIQATDAATTATALAALMATKLGSNRVLVTGSTNNVVLTAAVAGVDFTSDLWVSDPAAAVPVKTSNRSRATSFERMFVGVSLRRKDYEAAAEPNAGAQYDANTFVTIVNKTPSNMIAVNTGGSVALGDSAYVYLGATAADRGKFFNAAGTDRVWLPPTIAYFVGYDANSGLAMLKLNAELI